MAQLAVAGAGAAIGSAFGMPKLGFTVGALVGGFLFPSKPPAQVHYPVTSSAYGTPIPVLYGTMRLSGNLIWADNIWTKKTSAFGKGLGNSSTTPISRVDFAVAFCEGPVDSVTRMWADGMLIYDVTNPSLVQKPLHGTNFYFYNGSETQQPEPLIADWVSTNIPATPHAVPAYRGLCYIVFPAFTITNFGNRIPNITAELVKSSVPSTPSITLTSFSDPQVFINRDDAMAADWTRGVVYRGCNNGVKAYNLASNAEYQESVTGGLSTVFAEGQPFAVGQGGFIYATNSSAELCKIDQNSLSVVATSSTLPGNGTNAPAFGNVSLLIAQQVVTSAGTKDVIVGFWPYGSYLVFNDSLDFSITAPGVSSVTGGMPVAGANSGVSNSAVCGPVGTSSSIIYVANAGFYSNGVYLVTLTVRGTLSTEFNLLGDAIEPPVSMSSTFIPNTTFTPGTTTAGTSTNILYDQGDGCLIISAYGSTIKWNPSSSSVVWRYSNTISASSQSHISSGKIAFPSGGSITTLDTRTGAVIRSETITEGVIPSAYDSAASLYDGNSNSLYAIDRNTGTLVRIVLGGVASTGYPLADLVTDIACNKCGLSPSQIDTSLLTGTTDGYAVTHVTTGKDVIEQLQQAFFFDTVESDFMLKFVPKGTNPVATIPQQDLGSAGKPEDGNYWKHTRPQAIDVPTFVQINFHDVNNEYLPGAAYAKRTNAPVPTVYSKKRLVVDLPFSMSLTDASVTASKWLWYLWTSMNQYETSLGWQYLYLDPSDTITVNLDSGDSYTVRITQTNTGGNYSIAVQAVGEDIQTYTQNSNIVSLPSPYEKTIPPTTFARPFLLNVPLLQNSDDTAGSSSRIYYGAGALGGAWSGGELNTSLDGENFTGYDYLDTSVSWGTCLNALGNTTLPFGTDKTNTLTVMMAFENDTLSSATWLDFLNGANAALVGEEIIQFQNVVANADGTYTLSNLLRGRQGTEWACGTHSVGEPIVILDTNLHTNTISLSQIGVTQYVKMVPNGTFLDATPMTTVTYLGYDLMPYAPTNIQRTMSGGNLTVTWARRSRFDANLTDGTGTVPLGEATESYDAYILSAPYNPAAANYKTPASFVRSYLGLTSPTLTYAAADMATDGFAPGVATLHIVIFQNSEAVGHGWPGSANLVAF